MSKNINFFKALVIREMEEKELSPKQKQIAKLNEPKDKIDAGDFEKLNNKSKVSEGEDHEVSMAQSSLKEIISNASQLMEKIGQQEKDIPGWIQDHITNAENYINQANKGYYDQSITKEY